MRLLYTIGIYLYGFIARLFATFWRDQKVRQWVQGRKNLLKKIEQDLSGEKAPILWIHSASLGEFEQGRPLIERLKTEKPEYKILITFFSPSGYEIRKNYPLADYVYYLPEDTSSNARQFLKLVQPKAAVFIKYEYWYNYMYYLSLDKTPLIFISSIFRPSQAFFQFYGGWFLKHLDKVNHFFVQNEISKALLEEVGINQVSISGDTRFDRVAQIAEQVDENKIVKEFKNGQKLFLGGSTWPEDEKLISYIANKFPDLKILIAPHQIDEAHIQQIEGIFKTSIRYSNAMHIDLKQHQIMIINNMGLLSSLYQYADMAMIGGGFGAGIHNTLEAATFGMPIFIGPNYKKFQEAKDLISEGVIEVVTQEEDLFEVLSKYLKDEEIRSKISKLSKNYILKNKGATQQILSYLISCFD